MTDETRIRAVVADELAHDDEYDLPPGLAAAVREWAGEDREEARRFLEDA